MEPYWHEYNPWKDKVVYLGVRELVQVVGLDKFTTIILEYGSKIDVYLLPQPSGDHSFGVRYGPDGCEYLSLYIPKELAEVFYETKNNRT